MEDYNTLENKWEKNKHRRKLMNEPIIEISNADKVINKMTSGKVPTDDITKIRCFDCKKEIKEGESLFEHMRTECPGCLHWEFPVKKGGRIPIKHVEGIKEEEEEPATHIPDDANVPFQEEFVLREEGFPFVDLERLWITEDGDVVSDIEEEEDSSEEESSEEDIYGGAKKTRKKRGGWSRAKAREEGHVEGDNVYYQCSNRYPPKFIPQDWRYKDGIEISNESASQGKPIAQRFNIIKMNDRENSIGPVLRVEETTTPSSDRRFDIFAETMCDDGFKPVKKNEGKIGAGRRRKKTRKKQKKQFLYNPNDPSKSFDVYIDKNPNDTIPIKYTTVKDVEDTIKKLERLYKTKKYPHKRIWQVGMIMKVRLEAMNKYKKTRYKKAKKVFQRFQLANKYFKFLGERTKKKTFLERKKMTFNYKMPRRKTRKKQKGGYRMKETIIKFEKGPFPKKYTAFVKNKQTKKVRKIHFGDRRYQQYKDRTPLKLYKKNNHNTRKRMQNYFNRHSGTKKRGKAIKKEKNKSKGLYNAKILSHIYLW